MRRSWVSTFTKLSLFLEKNLMPGILYLLPNTLGNKETRATIPDLVAALLQRISVFIVEDLRNARRYLKSLDRDIAIDEMVFHVLNKHTTPEELQGFLREVVEGKNAAILSEAGVPGVADPGATVVRMAHEKGIRVVPLTGPSSVLLSLMASGLNGQAFRFHGYLPIKRPERVKKIQQLEKEASGSVTQIFIEAPYRNNALLADLLSHCRADTLLCIAADITMETEFIRTRKIEEWKKKVPELHKRPVVFLLGHE